MLSGGRNAKRHCSRTVAIHSEVGLEVDLSNSVCSLWGGNAATAVALPRKLWFRLITVSGLLASPLSFGWRIQESCPLSCCKTVLATNFGSSKKSKLEDFHALTRVNDSFVSFSTDPKILFPGLSEYCYLHVSRPVWEFAKFLLNNSSCALLLGVGCPNKDSLWRSMLRHITQVYWSQSLRQYSWLIVCS